MTGVMANRSRGAASQGRGLTSWGEEERGEGKGGCGGDVAYLCAGGHEENEDISGAVAISVTGGVYLSVRYLIIVPRPRLTFDASIDHQHLSGDVPEEGPLWRLLAILWRGDEGEVVNVALGTPAAHTPPMHVPRPPRPRARPPSSWAYPSPICSPPALGVRTAAYTGDSMFSPAWAVHRPAPSDYDNKNCGVADRAPLPISGCLCCADALPAARIQWKYHDFLMDLYR